MKIKKGEVLIDPKSPLFGVVLILFGGVAFLVQKLFVRIGFSSGTESFDFLMKLAGGALILFGIVEIVRRQHRFALTSDGFEDRAFGGIGVVGWIEVQRFRVIKPMLLNGAEVLVFDPVDWKLFWAARRRRSMLAPWLGSLIHGRAVAVTWLSVASSPTAAAEFLNQQLQQTPSSIADLRSQVTGAT